MYHKLTMKQIPKYTPVDIEVSGSVIHNIKPSVSYQHLPRAKRKPLAPAKPKQRVALAAWESLLAEIEGKRS
jgi:hypothetical protein